MTTSFSQIKTETPDFDTTKAKYDQMLAGIESGKDAAARVQAVRDWDKLRRDINSWEALVYLRFNQDTTNDEYKKAREYVDELRPKLTELDVQMKRLLVKEPARSDVVAEYGDHVVALWEVDILTYDPSIEEDVVAESKLAAEYNELLASAKMDFQGESHNLSGISKFLEDPDRNVRHEADKVRWDWFGQNRATLDRIFDELVKLRHAMAKKLGFNNYVELGYKKMTRIDYNQQDVERYREEVRKHVVPLGVEVRKAQAATLGIGVDELRHWDEAVYDPAGNPKPQSDYGEIIQAATDMFDAMGSGLDSFWNLMRDGQFMDLQNRSTKAGGGFCTSFDSYGLPYIFANFNGTKGDVEVFTHEVGHAFQCYMSRDQPLADYLWPTYESCEIHSMSLEFMTYPQMEKFFGDDADRFRKIHLTQSVLFLPYGVAVDHFQHLIYEKPDATPDERFAMWQEMERMYLPWRNYGDVQHPADGGRWQLQRHIYLSPFYYIDYTLAQACALQFWLRHEKDPAEAMQAYVELCKRGGEAPFQSLAKSAGLRSPFEPGCLDDVVQKARETLGV